MKVISKLGAYSPPHDWLKKYDFPIEGWELYIKRHETGVLVLSRRSITYEIEVLVGGEIEICITFTLLD